MRKKIKYSVTMYPKTARPVMTATRARMAPSKFTFCKGTSTRKTVSTRLSPRPKQNILPSQDAYQLRPQPVSPHTHRRPCCQREMERVFPHVRELPQRIEMFAGVGLSLQQTPRRYIGGHC